MVLDGVYAPKPDGEPEFFPLHAPETSDVQSVVEVLAKRIPALLVRREPDVWQGGWEKPDELAEKAPWLSDVYVASVTGRIATGPNAGNRVGGDRVDPEGMELTSSERCARVEGFSLHANVAVSARDRARLERLVRYVARPPLASERLEKLSDGRLAYEFKRPWRDGTTRAVFEPLEFIEKLAALVPTPRAHLTRYHGVLAPAAAWRAGVVPQGNNTADHPPGPPAVISHPPPETAPPAGSEDNARNEPPARHPRNYAWAELMRRVFEFDVLACDRCGGQLRLVAAIHPPETTRKILDCLGLPSRPPPLAPAIREQLDLA